MDVRQLLLDRELQPAIFGLYLGTQLSELYALPLWFALDLDSKMPAVQFAVELGGLTSTTLSETTRTIVELKDRPELQ